jgi:DNA-binding MarR family transcriptional regulator
MVGRFEQFCTAIAGIQRSIARIERVEMAKYGLKGAHAQCIIAMSRNPEGITAARLCELCERDKAAISRTVAELEEAGLLTRREQHGIRYRVPLVLTEAGKEAARNVNEVAGRAVEMAGVGLNDEQRDVFYHVLGIIAQNLHSISMHGLNEKE